LVEKFTKSCSSQGFFQDFFKKCRVLRFITQNWRGKPLISLATIVNLIASTTTKTGLKVSCVVDENVYLTGIKITDEEFEIINIIRNEFRGDLNYTIRPNKTLNH